METQNNAYQTNEMAELKREALANLDVSFLKQIRSYEQRRAKMRRYYVREGETDIRDREGKIVVPEALGIDLEWIDFYMLPIYYAWALPEMPDKPGDLYATVSIGPNSPLYDPTRILEVPAGTVFPLPEDFNWTQTCLNYRDSGRYVNRHDRSRLNCHDSKYAEFVRLKPHIVPGSKQAYESEHIKG